MIYEYRNYRDFIRSYVAQKIAENPQFSLRAMAKKLEITQPFLTEVIKGRKNLSPEMAHRVARKLELNDTEAEYFCVLAQAEATKDPHLKGSLFDKLKDLSPSGERYEDLNVETFRLISDWYHLVIRNMADIEGFSFQPGEIAKRLGITKIEAQAAIERLLRMGLIESDPANTKNYRKTKASVMVESDVPNEALRRFHRQMLEKAIESLESQTPQEKIVGSETFAFSPKYLKEADQITDEYLTKMSKLASRAGSKTQVYHLGVQFFNLTKERK